MVRIRIFEYGWQDFYGLHGIVWVAVIVWTLNINVFYFGDLIGRCWWAHNAVWAGKVRSFSTKLCVYVDLAGVCCCVFTFCVRWTLSLSPFLPSTTPFYLWPQWEMIYAKKFVLSIQTFRSAATIHTFQRLLDRHETQCSVHNLCCFCCCSGVNWLVAGYYTSMPCGRVRCGRFPPRYVCM
jgi:hypothetical protein